MRVSRRKAAKIAAAVVAASVVREDRPEASGEPQPEIVPTMPFPRQFLAALEARKES